MHYALAGLEVTTNFLIYPLPNCQIATLCKGFPYIINNSPWVCPMSFCLHQACFDLASQGLVCTYIMQSLLYIHQRCFTAYHLWLHIVYILQMNPQRGESSIDESIYQLLLERYRRYLRSFVALSKSIESFQSLMLDDR